MNNLIIDVRDLEDLNACIKTMLELGPVSVQLKSSTKRSLSQNALAHKWFGELSAWLVSKGKDFATRKWRFKAIFNPNSCGNSLKRLALKKIIIFEKT